MSAATPSSRPISSRILPFWSLRMVVPVKCIFRPVLAGRPTDEEIRKPARYGCRPLPLTDDIVAFSDEVGRAPEIEVRERRTEIGHEGLDVLVALPRLMQRIFQQHVRCGDFVDDAQDCRSCPRSR